MSKGKDKIYAKIAASGSVVVTALTVAASGRAK
jgi:hypothetical protein